MHREDKGAGVCEHEHTITTVTAGLARTACEQCGMVSISYAGAGAVWSGPAERAADLRAKANSPRPDPVSRPRPRFCSQCDAEAVYISPTGLGCSEHAWEAASRQESFATDFWIPLLIDRSNVTH